MLSLKRFKTLAESYGGELGRWPEAFRADAEMLLNTSPEACRFLGEARSLDDAISAASSHEAATLWLPGEENAALARLRSGIAARLPAQLPAGRAWPREIGWMLFGNVARLGMAGGCAVAVVAGLLIGSMDQPAPANVLTMLQPDALPVQAD